MPASPARPRSQPQPKAQSAAQPAQRRWGRLPALESFLHRPPDPWRALLPALAAPERPRTRPEHRERGHPLPTARCTVWVYLLARQKVTGLDPIPSPPRGRVRSGRPVGTSEVPARQRPCWKIRNGNPSRPIRSGPRTPAPSSPPEGAEPPERAKPLETRARRCGFSVRVTGGLYSPRPAPNLRYYLLGWVPSGSGWNARWIRSSRGAVPRKRSAAPWASNAFCARRRPRGRDSPPPPGTWARAWQRVGVGVETDCRAQASPLNMIFIFFVQNFSDTTSPSYWEEERTGSKITPTVGSSPDCLGLIEVLWTQMPCIEHMHHHHYSACSLPSPHTQKIYTKTAPFAGQRRAAGKNRGHWYSYFAEGREDFLPLEWNKQQQQQPNGARGLPRRRR